MRALLVEADARDPDFGALLRVLTATGARRGEVCGLRWADLDQHVGALFIRRSVASIAGGTIIKDTKTHAARRIALDADTLSTLERHRTRRDQLAAVCRVVCGDEAFVFTSAPDGSLPLPPDSITGRFGTLCRSLGLTGVRLHDLRHLHATQLLAAGVPVRTVSGRLGHANAATTLNVYAHALEVSDRQAADAIGGLLQSPANSGDSRDPGCT